MTVGQYKNQQFADVLYRSSLVEEHLGVEDVLGRVLDLLHLAQVSVVLGALREVHHVLTKFVHQLGRYSHVMSTVGWRFTK